MRLRLVATPVAFGPTDTSNYMGGAHRASFQVFRRDICLGGAHNIVEIPLFNVAEIRELAACYGAEGNQQSVYLTISTEDESAAGSPPASSVVAAPPLVNGRPSCCADAMSNKHVFGCADRRWAIWGDDLGNTAISFCPFCGIKLPEVPS